MNVRFTGLLSCNWNRWSDAQRLCGYEDVSLYLKRLREAEKLFREALGLISPQRNLRRVYEGPLGI